MKSMKYKMFVYDPDQPSSNIKILIASSNVFAPISNLMTTMESFATATWEVTEWDDVVYSSREKQL
jgi:hypothetical protein